MPKKTVKNLPPSGSNYFKKYGADSKRLELYDQPRCDHIFDRMSGREVECIKCHIGFFVTTETIKDGHIYKDGQLVI